MLRALKTVLLDEGTIAFTTLIETNRLADRYLHLSARPVNWFPVLLPNSWRYLRPCACPSATGFRGIWLS